MRGKLNKTRSVSPEEQGGYRFVRGRSPYVGSTSDRPGETGSLLSKEVEEEQR